LGGFSIDEEGGIFLIFLIHSSLFGFEQLLHGHGLVEMVLGLGDLFTGVFADTRCSAQFGERSRVVPKMVALRRAPVLVSVARRDGAVVGGEIRADGSLGTLLTFLTQNGVRPSSWRRASNACASNRFSIERAK
jgi:hypothetical protein